GSTATSVGVLAAFALTHAVTRSRRAVAITRAIAATATLAMELLVATSTAHSTTVPRTLVAMRSHTRSCALGITPPRHGVGVAPRPATIWRQVRVTLTQATRMLRQAGRAHR